MAHTLSHCPHRYISLFATPDSIPYSQIHRGNPPLLTHGSAHLADHSGHPHSSHSDGVFQPGGPHILVPEVGFELGLSLDFIVFVLSYRWHLLSSSIFSSRVFHGG